MADAVPGLSRLAGRDRELAALRRWAAEALAGHGRLALVLGPPGIGKTRLAEELADGLRREGQRVLWGRAVQERGTPPLWPWRRILNAVGDGNDSAGLIDVERPDGAISEDLVAARFRAAAAAADAIIAAAGAADLLVVLEDMQWADHASLFLLRELASGLPGSRLLVLVTCRDSAGAPWRASLGDLARLPSLQLLQLAPLDETAVTEILTATGLSADPGLVQLVHARSEGNPLYATALARLLATQPGTERDASTLARLVGSSAEVSHIVAALLGDLTPDVRDLLTAASVLGAEFSYAMAAKVRGTSDTAVELAAAEASGLIVRQPSPGSWRFAHALIRDGIYASITEVQRISLHARAAAALEPLAETAPERGGEIAAHLLQASPDRPALRRAAKWAAIAATAATSALAFEDAAEHLVTALTAAESADGDDAERAELLVELATAEYRAGQFAASLKHAAAAAAAAERDGRGDLMASAALVVRGLGHRPVATTLIGLCDRALAASGYSPALGARLLAQRASALAELGDIAAADAESAAAMAAADAVSDPAAELDAIRARVAALLAPQNKAERLRLSTRAIELAAVARQPLAAVLGHVWRIDAAYQYLDLETVDAEIIQIAQLADSTRLPLARWHLLRQQASRAALSGQLTIARDRSDEARQLALRMQDPSGAGMTYAFAIWLASIRGDAGEIPADFFEFAAAVAPSTPAVRVGLARALFAVGRVEEAQAVYETLRRLPAAGEADAFRTLGALTQLIDLIIAFGDAEMARSTYDILHRHVDDTGVTGTGVVFLSGSLHWPLGRLAALLGQTEQAVGHFATAVTIHTRLGARPVIALARLDWAETLRTHSGNDGLAQSRVLARQAAAEARRLDMPGPADRAERLARELDLSFASSNPLTTREREIADLVSAGLTNRAIADRLVLSERTVEAHVRSGLGKLQLTNRTELAAWVFRNIDP